MAKKRSSSTPVVAFIGLSTPLTKKQRTQLRSIFGKGVIDVLGAKVASPRPEVFPIDFDPTALGAGKKPAGGKALDVMGSKSSGDSPEVFPPDDD